MPAAFLLKPDLLRTRDLLTTTRCALNWRHCACFFPLLLTPMHVSEPVAQAVSMSEKSSKPKTPDPLLEKSSLYQEFLAEREEIMRHKWLKSEEAGHDIGFDATLLDWVMNYRTDWKQERKAKPVAKR